MIRNEAQERDRTTVSMRGWLLKATRVFLKVWSGSHLQTWGAGKNEDSWNSDKELEMLEVWFREAMPGNCLQTRSESWGLSFRYGHLQSFLANERLLGLLGSSKQRQQVARCSLLDRSLPRLHLEDLRGIRFS